MEEDLRDILKRAILSESYEAAGGKMAKKPRKSRKSKKSKGGVSNLSLLGPVSVYGDSQRLKDLVKQMIQEEIARGGLFIAPSKSTAERHSMKIPKRRVAGYHGCHPMDYDSDCSCGGGTVSGALGAGAIGGYVVDDNFKVENRCSTRKIRKGVPSGLAPYTAANKAIKGLKFRDSELKNRIVKILAKHYYDIDSSPSDNVKYMRESVHRVYDENIFK